MATAPLHRILGQLRVPLADAPDPDLLKAFLATRDPAAFAAIVRRHGSTVLNACRQVLRHEADVEDAFQATFLILLKSARSIRERQSLGSWLFGVAHRVSVHARCRRAKLETRERTNEEPPHPAEDSPDLSWREASAVLHEELNRLPDKLRQPLLLCYLEGKSRDEAAAELGWSVGRVKGCLERGRLRLRDRLQRRGIALSAGLLAAVAVAPGSAAPPGWVDSVVSFAGSGTVRPAVSALAKGVSPMLASARRWASALAAAILIGAGTLIAASTSPKDLPKKEPPAAAKEDPKPPAGEKLVVTGKVTDAGGRPVAGAKLFVPYFKKFPPATEDDIGAREVGQTAADGTYKVEVEKTEITRYLIVGADGHAIGWANLERAKGTHAADIQLARDVTAEGRVIDTEGKPVAGAAVRVMTVYAPAEGKLDRFLTGWKADWSDALRLLEDRMYMPLETVHGSGKADKDGKFTLKGVGVDRIASVEVAAPGYAKQAVYVITRPGLDAGPINKAAHEKIPIELRIPGQPPMLSGPKVEVVLQGTKVIEGTVTDAGTGKPLAGVVVNSGSGYNSHVTSTSDKDGKYRLAGLVKNRQYLLHTFTRDKNTPYLTWSARLEDTEGLSPIRHDIRMTRGVMVTGRVIDRTTGKPVQRAGIRFAPLPDNKYFGTSPAYSGYSSNRMSEEVRDGRFRVVTIPGKSLLMVQAYDGAETIGGKPVNPYKRAVPDPDHPGYFARRDEDGYTVTAAGNSLEFLDSNHVVKVVDLKPDAGEVAIDLYVERGKTASLKVVDPDGKPLGGVTVAGLTASWPHTFRLPRDTATVYALDPARPRTLYLLHPEKKLAGTVKVTGDEAEPVVAKLAPTGTVTGKLVEDARPVAGVTVGLQFPGGPGNELYRETRVTQAPVVTDQDGAFKLDGVVPGVKFSLSLMKGQTYYVGEPRIGLKQVEAGKTLELGTLPVKGRRLGE